MPFYVLMAIPVIGGLVAVLIMMRIDQLNKQQNNKKRCGASFRTRIN